MKNYFSLAVGDEVEVVFNSYGKVTTFVSKVEVIPNNKSWVIVRTNDRNIGFEVTPYLINRDKYPPSLEGQFVIGAENDPNYGEQWSYRQEEWARINKVIKKPASVKQIRQTDPGGSKCCLCGRFTQYASSNMSDGSFCCYNCRDTKKWKLRDGVVFIG